MCPVVILIEELLFVILLVFLTESSYSLGLTMTAHVLAEITITNRLLWVIGNESPGEDRVLCDIIVISACDLIQPLQVLIIGHVLIDPE